MDARPAWGGSAVRRAHQCSDGEAATASMGTTMPFLQLCALAGFCANAAVAINMDLAVRL